MTKPFALLSDQHCHKWSAYATTNADGVNSRLQIILDEIERAADELIKAGGDTMIFAGDLFHSRGSIDPEVFNPVHDLLTKLSDRGIEIVAIPGNHDLKGNETTELGNAIQTLKAIKGFDVVTTPLVSKRLQTIFIPWMHNLDDLRAKLRHLAVTTKNHHEYDVVIHAGINGVVFGPDNGLSSEELAAYEFKRVFAGHYHNHKVMENGKVISIGSLTHQTWNDVGTKSGFLLVEPNDFRWFASNAPEFIEINTDTNEEEIPLVVDGNYVRIRGFKLNDKQFNQMRDELTSMGAKGFNFQIIRDAVTVRGTAVSGKSMSIAESVSSFIEEKDPDMKESVLKESLRTLELATATKE